MSGGRRGRRAAGVIPDPLPDQEEGAVGGLLHSPPNAPPVNINQRSPIGNQNLQRSPPPMYFEAVPEGMPRENVRIRNPIPQVNAPMANPNQELPAVLQQMMQMMQQNQNALLNALQNIRGPNPVQPGLHNLQPLNAPVQRVLDGQQQNLIDHPVQANANLNFNFARPNINPGLAFAFGRGRPNNPLQPHVNRPPPNIGVNIPAQVANNLHARTQHLKSSDAKIPLYSGSSDAKTPYDFIIELEKYQAIVGYTENDMIQYVIPLALIQDAYNWYRYEPDFMSWDDFRKRLRAEFQTLGYQDELKRELDNRSQGPSESLTSYIRIIIDYYERLGEPVNEFEVVSRIMKRMHPEYRKALIGRNIQTVAELKQAAHLAQELIKDYRTYKPPPVSGSLEPSLAWKPISMSKDTSKGETESTMTVESVRNASKLSLASVDPYAYHHPTAKKEVKFQVNPESTSSPRTPPRNAEPLARTPPRENFINRERRNSGGSDNGNERGCFSCGSKDHFKRNCPRINKSPASGNGSSPSPNRR